jgi:hypothetical protein
VESLALVLEQTIKPVPPTGGVEAVATDDIAYSGSWLLLSGF